MKPFIDPAFWSDPDIEGAKAGIKLTLLWLITNSRTNLLGICGASSKRFEFETGLPEKALDEAVKALPRAIERFGDDIFVKNYIRHQFGSGDKLTRNNFFVALSSLFVGLRNDPLRSSILTNYPEFTEAQKGFEGLTKPKDRIGKDREGEWSVRGTKSKPVSEAETVEFCRSIGIPDGAYFWNKWNGSGFLNAGKPMRDWKSTIRSWKDAGHCPSQKHRNGTVDIGKKNRLDEEFEEAQRKWTEKNQDK